MLSHRLYLSILQFSYLLQLSEEAHHLQIHIHHLHSIRQINPQDSSLLQCEAVHFLLLHVHLRCHLQALLHISLLFLSDSQEVLFLLPESAKIFSLFPMHKQQWKYLPLPALDILLILPVMHGLYLHYLMQQ